MSEGLGHIFQMGSKIFTILLVIGIQGEGFIFYNESPFTSGFFKFFLISQLRGGGGGFCKSRFNGGEGMRSRYLTPCQKNGAPEGEAHGE